MSHNRCRRPNRTAAAEAEAMATRAQEARNSILGSEVNDNRVYRTPAQNLVAAAALADAIKIDPAHPTAGNFNRAITLIKMAVELQDEAISERNRSASESAQTRPSASGTARTRSSASGTIGSSLPSRTPSRTRRSALPSHAPRRTPRSAG